MPIPNITIPKSVGIKDLKSKKNSGNIKLKIKKKKIKNMKLDLYKNNLNTKS